MSRRNQNCFSKVPWLMRLSREKGAVDEKNDESGPQAKRSLEIPQWRHSAGTVIIRNPNIEGQRPHHDCRFSSCKCRKFGRHRNGLQRFKCPTCRKNYTEDHVRLFGAMTVQEDKAILAIQLLNRGYKDADGLGRLSSATSCWNFGLRQPMPRIDWICVRERSLR